jgi:hypothetical protein
MDWSGIIVGCTWSAAKTEMLANTIKGEKMNTYKKPQHSVFLFGIRGIVATVAVVIATLLGTANAVVDSGISVVPYELIDISSDNVGYLPESIVAVVDTANTFGDFDAWTITNNSSFGISEVILRFTVASNGNFDDNLPSQVDYSFNVHASSDPTGVNHAYADPSSAPADFNGWRTLVLTFTDFNPGETLVFGQDTDGSIGTIPPAWGAASGDAFADNLEFLVTTSAFSASTFFTLSGPNASTAIIPEPTTVCLMGLGSLLLPRRRRK